MYYEPGIPSLIAYVRRKLQAAPDILRQADAARADTPKHDGQGSGDGSPF